MPEFLAWKEPECVFQTRRHGLLTMRRLFFYFQCFLFTYVLLVAFQLPLLLRTPDGAERLPTVLSVLAGFAAFIVLVHIGQQFVISRIRVNYKLTKKGLEFTRPNWERLLVSWHRIKQVDFAVCTEWPHVMTATFACRRHKREFEIVTYFDPRELSETELEDVVHRYLKSE